MRVVIPFLVALTICSCRQKEPLYTDKDLEDKIKKAVTSGDNILDLSAVADFEWDSLLIITPYANFDDTEANLNIDLSRTKHVNIESRDDINQLIFYLNNEPIKMVEYPRVPGDFSDNKIEFISRDSAEFDIMKPIDKKTRGDWLTLKRRR